MTVADESVRVEPHPLYPLALGPWELEGLPLRNRICMSAHGTNYQLDGAPTPRYVEYLAERARGGAGLIFTEGAHVHRTSGGPHMIDLWRESSRPGLEALAQGVHDHGGAVFVQIMHNGRQMEPAMTGRPVVSASRLQGPAHLFVPHQLSRREIAELVTSFASSAEVVAKTGFDGVEVHVAHGYLLEQFLSPYTNRRSDQYGGSHENRLRFARDVVRAVLDKVGSEVIVGARVPAYETAPGGLDTAEAKEFTKELAAEGLQFVSVTLGQHDTPLMTVPPAGVPTLPDRQETAELRREVSCAVIASHRVRTIADAETALQEGTADMVNMLRAHIADPEIVEKTRAGREDEVRVCIGCVQGCRGQLMLGLPTGCLVNPRAGREREHILTLTARPKRVAVVGGGIAGMQFASTAASRGHELTLFERSEVLGGVFRRSAELPEREEVARFTDVLERELALNGVTVRLSEAPTQDGLKEYDSVVVATGGLRKSVDRAEWGFTSGTVLSLEEALQRGVPQGSNVVIVDRGDHYNAAILLARKLTEESGGSIDILDPVGSAARRLDALNRSYMTRDFDAHGIRFASNVTGLSIDGSTVRFDQGGWSHQIDHVTVLVVIEPLEVVDPDEWASLDNVTFLGDCDAPGLAVEIVHEAYVSALEL